ncbi:MAG TPA: AzlD domain-containing protein [Actinomycetota bacterium]|nr:AzlD domain-containing protein [Actinomycetota bacterium]
MNLVLIAILGVMTFSSRAIGLVLMPKSEGRLQEIFQRLPAGLFAALAVVSLLDDSGSIQSTRSLVAAIAALVVSPTRSLPLIFVSGIAGYLVSALVL